MTWKEQEEGWLTTVSPKLKGLDLGASGPLTLSFVAYLPWLQASITSGYLRWRRSSSR